MLTHNQRNLINRFAGLFERNIIEPFLSLNKIKPNPIFIIGPPRSGTTLIYRWVIHHLNEPVAYLSRLSDLYPDAAWLFNKIGLYNFGKQTDINRSQHYGQIKGLTAPAEGNHFPNPSGTRAM